MWGSRPYVTADGSRNNLRLALLTLGEGWHDNHHHCRSSCRQGVRWWEIDVTYLVRLFDELGVKTLESDMPFAVTCPTSGFEDSSRGVRGFFADRRRLASASHLRPLRDIVRLLRGGVSGAPHRGRAAPAVQVGEPTCLVRRAGLAVGGKRQLAGRSAIGRRRAAMACAWALPLVLLPATGLGQDTAGVGAVRGVVTGPNGAPVADIAVCVRPPDRCTATDTSGRFVLNDVRAGRYELDVVQPSMGPLTSAVDVRAGRDTVVEVSLPAADIVRETVTVAAPTFVAAEEVKSSAYLVSGGDVVQSAGALQDVSRYVQSLPGVVIGTDDFRNDLIVRGGSPLENLYIVDNVEIPNINTFANFASAGGTVSVLDALLLQDVTFLTGGFPAAYGHRASSVLQIALREGDRQRRRGRVTFGFAGAGGVAEGPLGSGRGSWIVSARRSVLDLVTTDVGIGGVPVLYTLNAKATYDLTPRDRIWILNVTGVDRIRLGLTEGTDLSDELSNLDIRYRGGRAATGVNWQRTFGGKGVGLLGATYSRAWVRSAVADLLRNGIPGPDTSVGQQLASGETVFRERSAEGELALKYDITSYARGIGKVQGGVSVRRGAIDYDAASPFGTDSPYFREPDQNPLFLRERSASYLTAGYGQLSRALGSRVDITAGARLDRFGLLSATRLAPRGAASLTLTRRVSLRVSAGQYFQPPLALFVRSFPDNARLRPFRADHAVAGVVWMPDDGIRLTAEVYHKRYRDYPVSSQVSSLSLANIGDTFAVRDVLFPLVSAGKGEASGVELFAERRARPAARWYGQANLALSRARYAGRDGVLRPGSFDYPVVANALGSLRLGERWELATRVAFLSGRPYTPIDPAASAAAHRAIYDVALINRERSGAYFRADVRVDRRFTINGRPVLVFAGVQNATNRRNIAGYTWDRRAGGVKTQEQLGVFPILGLDWQF